MDFTPLRRHRDYRLLYIAQSVSFLGTMMTYVALPYQMFQLTHSSFIATCKSVMVGEKRTDPFVIFQKIFLQKC